MKNKYFILFLLIIFITAGCTRGNNNEQKSGVHEPVIKIYKTVGDRELHAHIFNPDDLKSSDRRPAYIFFHGGGWALGEAKWGYKDCVHFSKLGMVAITIEYRLALNDITPIECINDAKSAVRWVRKNAEELCIDPDKIVAAGFSAGGHLAASTAIIKGLDEANEDQNISSSPNALILWSAAVNPAVDAWFPSLLMKHDNKKNYYKNISKYRVDTEKYSPFHHIQPKLPPTILFHGKNDSTVPVKTVIDFAKEMKKAGNICELHLFNCGHFFKNRGYVLEVIKLRDDFLAKLKFIDASQPVKQ